MESSFTPSSQPTNCQRISLPSTWFEKRITLEQIRSCFSTGREEIRIACGFFTVKGWGLIRRYTEGKRVYLLVGIDEPGEERARTALVKEIMRHLATGLDLSRRQSVEDLVARMHAGVLYIVDARASSHHGKLYIVDRHTAINASANTTGRGFLEQIESGGLYAPSEVERFVSEYNNRPGVNITPEVVDALHRFVESQVANFIIKFDEYFASAADITQELLEALASWLDFVPPWDIYLKTILALEQIKSVKTSYGKQPVSYQQDMIAQALRQIQEYGGSMLVASTGLGKTVMGTHIAIQLQAEDLIDNVIVICPRAVRKAWIKEMRDASIHADCFTLHTLDSKDTNQAGDLEKWEDIVEHIRSRRGRYLLILDESHQLRKRYPDEFGNRRQGRRERRAFTRINEIVNQIGNTEKVKVLLLSGSPYATSIDNINTQLALLPHTATISVSFPDLFKDSSAWRIEEAEQFIKLPVTHQLTTPHVAKYYGQVDSQGRYLKFGEQKRYFPDVVLYSLSFPLLFENELGSAILNGYLDLDTPQVYRKNIVNLVKVSWASSPLALQEVLERVVDTPKGSKAFDFSREGRSNFVFAQNLRQEVFNPILKKLKRLKYEGDRKLQNLIQILKFYCPEEKVIIFCERYATACYLEEALSQLMPDLRLFSTVAEGSSVVEKYGLKIDKLIDEAIAIFAPVANDAVGKFSKTYDVFIATDAFGIGVNMQDASVVVNYDIAWTPIEPIQRSGRILRLWHCPRTVKLYTFTPTLREQTELRHELLDIQKRWDNLMQRHGESRKFTDLPVLTINSRLEINMPDFAPDTEVKSGSLTLERTDDEGVSPYFQHTGKLHPYREYAQNLRSDLVSALTYPGDCGLLYILLKVQDKYHVLLYDPKTQVVRSPSPEYILDLIKCTPETEAAMADASVIEELSDACIRAWCLEHHIDEEEVIRECTLYLKPEHEGDSVRDWLQSQRRGSH